MERRQNLTPFRARIGWQQPPCRFFFFILTFCMVQLFGTLLVRAQFQEGFISIDCGLVGGSDYGDHDNGLQYTGDSRYIDTGENKNVSENRFARRYGTLRSFPNGTRNCYRLSPVQSGNKYLIRAIFTYGNYDGKNSSPTFDLHIGVNFWTTVTIGSDPDLVSEIITVSRGNVIQVCLVNTGKGTPFISVLLLRPLDVMYPFANASQSLDMYRRSNYGAERELRYPDDPYDRIWTNVTEDFLLLNTTSEVDVKEDDAFRVPSKVLQTAVSDTRTDYNMTIQAVRGSPGERIYVVMHFAELLKLNSPNESRQMDIKGLDGNVRLFENYSPPYLRVDHIEIANVALDASGSYNVSIYASSSSTCSFTINALESFIVRPMNESETDDHDVSAIEDIKRAFKLSRNWEADPCSPRNYTWQGVSCNYSGDSGPARIISLDLSSSNLDGPIPTSIGNLTALVTLDLSNNNLTGPVPDILGELQSLQLLNLSRNEAIGAIPQNLCEKMFKGAISLSIYGDPKQCESLKSNKRKKIIITIIIVSQINKTRMLGRVQEEMTMLGKEKYQIGKGGFGTVYLGNLNDGTNVAVKVLSSSSLQGSKEFEAEVLLLGRVHHKNLVCLLGYCADSRHLSLVYEYMDNKTLKDHLSGIHDASLLNWNQRVNIALQSAQGLDYLHNGCQPPIIHRDIKSSNILLNCELVAKLADFGLSRTFNTDSATHITTRFGGTPGYLAPEYFQNDIINQKGDVYSFGIVLLEIITGQPLYQNSMEKTHIVKWIHSKVQNGDINNIIDPKLQGDFDINMAWKVVEIAMSCTSTTLEERMTMTDVMVQLKECLDSFIQSSNGTFVFGSATPTILLCG
ncbi:unnamed protein product [Spirodela intermedia]|uniref:Protein kinase domain-containing protein n=1 Tax=Spirodela intermedia TaxID=51605 RepID=A0A7I8L3F3_SPIIN|nr:unnamed protein product [Spirodela intermedia]